ncbi:YdgA family protein [Pseudomonas sp. MM211]|uniref:YdgA family protein n=1 Tax=Pseudomonas sp. MM211 TaxID=2866808 RepID=UPI001CED6FE8|nr:YdgA family protein [Pseudomonas sp. MM211]UCJ14770.1 YdgA family protein [Pseudomonas sp. MM211]
MKKIVGIAVGVVVAVGVLSTAGAWYTGTQLPGVLQNAIAEANQQGQDALLGTGATIKLELVSLDTRFFTSTAHYRLSFDAPAKEDVPRHLEVLLVDNIEHGPLPVSRLKRLNLWPVMAASNYALEANELTQKWFDAAKGAAPLTGQGSLGYDGSTSGTLVLTPLDFAPTATSAVKFSGLSFDIEASKHAEKLLVSGTMNSLLISVAEGEEAPIQAELRGLTLDSDQHLASGDFYLGDSSLKLATAQIKVGDKPAVLIKDMAQFGSLQETSGMLNGRMGYDIGMVSYDGKDLAGMHMLWSLKNIDAAVVQSLLEFYREKLTPIQQAQALDQEAPDFAFSDAEEARLKSDLEKLLSAKPQIALEKYSVKTTNGEASLSMALDLNKPESFELAPDEIAKQMIAKLEAKLSIAKAIIGDGVRAQAMIEGQTDAKAIEDQAAMFTEMGSGMALGTGLLTLEGDTLQSSLHYANDKVTFNGQDMTVEEFAMFVMSKANGLGGGALGGDDQSQYDDSEEAYPEGGIGEEDYNQYEPQDEAADEQ